LIERLTAVRGIGRWTAEMYLMFQLRRLDVWPVDDLGVRQGYALAWKIDPPPTPKQLEPLGDRFRPYRSIVARYCWAAVPLLRAGGTDVDLR
jgi:3-methyladenine DNA glycosylase/8-oxoguanine DNA glycosylase